MDCKTATHAAIMEFYEKQGLQTTLKVAAQMLITKNGKDNAKFATDLHGEICESVLEVLVIDYCKQHPKETKDWRYCKGVILKNRDRLDAEFMTEIDFMLLTPQCIYLFECKSYAGDKELTGQGLLTRKASATQKQLQCNVFNQSLIHKETAEKWLEGFVIRGKLPLIQMCMFDFSTGTLVDNRSRAAKLEMPCLGYNSLLKFLDTDGEVVWNSKVFDDVVRKLSQTSKLCNNHLNYVKSLHRKG